MSTLRRLVLLLMASLLLLVVTGCASNGGVNRQDAADANASIGADYLQKKQNDQALRSFRKALSFDDDNFSANWGMAIVNNRLGRTEEAGPYYRRALDLQPGASVYNSYGAYLCERGDTAEAVKYFDQAAAVPQYADAPDALANAGLCLYRHQQPEAASRYFRKALDSEPSQFTALSRMAAIEHDRHNDLNARAFIERADAAGALESEQLLLAARIELAMHDRQVANDYLTRYNASQPSKALSLSQLESTRQ